MDWSNSGNNNHNNRSSQKQQQPQHQQHQQHQQSQQQQQQQNPQGSTGQEASGRGGNGSFSRRNEDGASSGAARFQPSSQQLMMRQQQRQPQQQQQQQAHGGDRATQQHPETHQAPSGAEDEEERNPLLSSLLDHLVELAHQAGFAEELIEVSKARLLLEATAGQVPLAAQLYWDDVLARTHEQNNHSGPASAANAGVSVAGAAPDPPPPIAEQKQQASQATRQRVLRRRLETDYESLQQLPPPEQHGSTRNHTAVAAAAAPPAPQKKKTGSRVECHHPPAWAAPGLSAQERHERMMAPQKPTGGRIRTVPARQAAVAAAQAIAQREREFEQKQRPLSEQERRDLEQASRQEAAARDGLENHFQDPEDDDDEEEDGDYDEEDQVNPSGGGRRGPSRRRRRLENEGGDDDHAIEEDDHDGPRPRLVVARGMEASVSVSDDEAAADLLRTVKAVQKRIRGKPPGSGGRKRPSSSQDDLVSPSSSKRSRTGENRGDDDEDGGVSNMEVNGYLSDNDWIWESLSTTPRESIPPVPPMDFLWSVPGTFLTTSDARNDGAAGDKSENGKKSSDVGRGNGASNHPENNDDVVFVDLDEHPPVVRAVSHAKSGGTESTENGSAQQLQPMDESSTGDGDDNMSTTNLANDDDDDDKGATIPVTWLRAGFGFSSDEKLGLSCNGPNEDDIAYLQWKQQMPASNSHPNSRRRGGKKQHQSPRPPYHCPSITLLPAIVTALLQAGVTVVKETNVSAPRVTCQTTQKPYHQLDPQTRAREWEARLVDALTALLVIAAQSSKERKTKALERGQRMEQQQHHQQQKAAPKDPSTNKVVSAPASFSVGDSRKKKRGDFLPSTTCLKKGHGKGENSDNPGPPDTVCSGAASAAAAKWQKLHSKLQLCPTCWWEKVDPNSNNVQPHSNTHGHILPNPEKPISIPLSYTHICDLRSYVKSNLDAFLGTGGCALFLETILRIHGKGAVQRMVQAARQEELINSTDELKKGHFKNKLPPLVQCNCQERYQKAQQNQRIASWPDPNKKAKEKEDASDAKPYNECASVELVSLLLTGRVYSTWKGWSTDMAPYATLGIGLLTDRPGEVGRGLTRPLKPVWIIKGPSQYSVLWLNDRNSAGVLDESRSFVANMTHWSCWYSDAENDLDDAEGEVHSYSSQTNFRFMAGKENQGNRGFLSVMGETKAAMSWGQKQPSVSIHDSSPTLSLLEERRKKEKQAMDDLKSPEYVGDNHIFTQEDLERVRVHADDMQYYDNFRLWRYDIPPRNKENANSKEGDKNNDDDEGVKKPQGERWTPFHRLNEYDKMLVETKLGPKLAVMLRTRWPGARIDRMEPSKPLPLV